MQRPAATQLPWWVWEMCGQMGTGASLAWEFSNICICICICNLYEFEFEFVFAFLGLLPPAQAASVSANNKRQRLDHKPKTKATLGHGHVSTVAASTDLCATYFSPIKRLSRCRCSRPLSSSSLA